MSEFGLRNCAETTGRRAPLASAKPIGLCLSMIGLLLLGACASNDGATLSARKSQAHQDLRSNTEKLSEPLDGTVEEAKVAGGLFGTGISFGLGSVGVGGGKKKSVRIGLPLGVFAGSLAGKYVSAKQREYSAEVEVVESITEDVRGKNQYAERTIAAMEVVVAEDRARLAELRGARSQGKVSENTLERQIAFARDDLATMKQAIERSEGHLTTFTETRAIVVKRSKNPDLSGGPEMSAMDSQIEVLRARIRAMKGLVDELASVS